MFQDVRQVVVPFRRWTTSLYCIWVEFIRLLHRGLNLLTMIDWRVFKAIDGSLLWWCAVKECYDQSTIEFSCASSQGSGYTTVTRFSVLPVPSVWLPGLSSWQDQVPRSEGTPTPRSVRMCLLSAVHVGSEARRKAHSGGSPLHACTGLSHSHICTSSHYVCRHSSFFILSLVFWCVNF